jgi:hypothetical protein
MSDRKPKAEIKQAPIPTPEQNKEFGKRIEAAMAKARKMMGLDSASESDAAQGHAKSIEAAPNKNLKN